MSQEFVYATAPAPIHDDGSAVINPEQFPFFFTDEVIDNVRETYLNLNYCYNLRQELDDDEWMDNSIVRDRMVKAFSKVFLPWLQTIQGTQITANHYPDPETSIIAIDGRVHLISGGMSDGEDPTRAFGIISDADELDLFDLPLESVLRANR